MAKRKRVSEFRSQEYVEFLVKRKKKHYKCKHFDPNFHHRLPFAQGTCRKYYGIIGACFGDGCDGMESSKGKIEERTTIKIIPCPCCGKPVKAIVVNPRKGSWMTKKYKNRVKVTFDARR